MAPKPNHWRHINQALLFGSVLGGMLWIGNSTIVWGIIGFVLGVSLYYAINGVPYGQGWTLYAVNAIPAAIFLAILGSGRSPIETVAAGMIGGLIGFGIAYFGRREVRAK